MAWTDRGQISDTYGFYSTGLVNLHHDDQLLLLHRGSLGDLSLWHQLYRDGKWQGDKKLPKHTSSNGSAVVMWKRSCFAIHRGAESDEQLYSAQFTLEGEKWGPDTKLPDAFSSNNPAAAEFTIAGKPHIVVVHRGWQADQQLWFMTNDGHGWTKGARLGNHHSSDAPALAVYNGLLYCLHRGARDDRNIYMTTFDGKSWSPDAALPDHHTGYSPDDWGGGPIGVAVYNGKIHMVHKGDRSNSLWHSHYNGTTWSTDAELVAGGAVIQGDGISLAVLKDVLYVCYRQRQSHRVCYLTYTESPPH